MAAKERIRILRELPACRLPHVGDLLSDIITSWKLEPDSNSRDDKDAARSQVLGNDDLLHQVFQHCSRESIQNLRLCSRLFESVAARYLFERLTLGYRKRYFRRLLRVAAVEKFRKGVRELVFEGVPYYNGDYVKHQRRNVVQILGWLKVNGITLAEGHFQKIERAASKLNSFATDQMNLHNQCAELKGVIPLITAIMSFPGLRKVTLTQWAQHEAGLLFDVDALLGDSPNAPPPYHLFLDRSCDVGLRTAGGLLMLLVPSLLARHRIKEFVMEPTPSFVWCKDHGTLTRIRPPGMTVDWTCVNPEWSRDISPALRHLKKLHIELSIEDRSTSTISSMLRLLVGTTFWHVFQGLQHLEDIFIRVHTGLQVKSDAMLTCIIPLSKIFDTESP